MMINHKLTSVLGCTTSGREQGFAVEEWLTPGRRGRLEVDRLNDEAKLVIDYRAEEVPIVLQKAQEIWERTYGPVRSNRRQRLDKGMPHNFKTIKTH